MTHFKVKKDNYLGKHCKHEFMTSYQQNYNQIKYMFKAFL